MGPIPPQQPTRCCRRARRESRSRHRRGSGDARYADIRTLLTEQLPAKGITAPKLRDPPPFHADPLRELDLTHFRAVIFTSGFRPRLRPLGPVPAFEPGFRPLTGCRLTAPAPPARRP